MKKDPGSKKRNFINNFIVLEKFIRNPLFPKYPCNENTKTFQTIEIASFNTCFR